MRYFGLLAALLLSGCVTAKTWIVQQRPDGGVIGYTGAGEDDFQEKFNAAVAHLCGERKSQVVRDDLRSSQGSYNWTSTQTTQVQGYDTSGNAFYGTVSQPVTTTHQYTSYWREAEVSCASH